MRKSFPNRPKRATDKTKLAPSRSASVRGKDLSILTQVIPEIRPSLEPVFFQLTQKDTAALKGS
jgi:hypothetical protein